MVKNLKIFPNVVLIAQIKRFGALNATQKTKVLYNTALLLSQKAPLNNNLTLV